MLLFVFRLNLYEMIDYIRKVLGIKPHKKYYWCVFETIVNKSRVIGNIYLSMDDYCSKNAEMVIRDSLNPDKEFVVTYSRRVSKKEYENNRKDIKDSRSKQED